MVFYRLSGALRSCGEAINGGHCYFDNRVSQSCPAYMVSGNRQACAFEWQVARRVSFGTSDTSQNFHPHFQRALRQTILLLAVCGSWWCHFDPMAALHDAASPATSPISFRWPSGRAENGPPAAAGRTASTTGRRQMSRDPGSPTAEPSPQSGLSAFFEVSTPRFLPAGQTGRSTRDLQQ